MRFMEIANPEDQLALWRLISDNVWSAVMTQAKQAAAQKAQAAACLACVMTADHTLSDINLQSAS